MMRMRRDIENRMIDEGLRPDGRGRSRVRQVLAWRGSGRRLEAFVDWAGVDTGTGLPHSPSWQPASRLTSDLLEGIRKRREKRSAAEASLPSEEVGPRGEKRTRWPSRLWGGTVTPGLR